MPSDREVKAARIAYVRECNRHPAGWEFAIRAALQAAEQERQEWRPIETAPKTSKAILVYCSERMNTYVVSWGQLGGFLGNKGWRHFGGNSDLSYEEPTYWMPLPNPPKEGE